MILVEVVLIDTRNLRNPCAPSKNIERRHPSLHLIVAPDVIGRFSALLRLPPPSPLSVIEEIHCRRGPTFVYWIWLGRLSAFQVIVLEAKLAGSVRS